MKLSYNQIKEIATGAVRTEEDNGAVRLYRFTKEQEEVYHDTYFSSRTFSQSGIRLSFITDSTSLFLKVDTAVSSSRTYFSVDIFADGEAIGYVDNFSDREPVQNYPNAEYPLGEFSGSFSLGEGEKTVCIHLPWSVATSVCELSLDDGAYVRAVKPEKKLLAYGDSITHGYDALRPSHRYIGKIADLLGAEEFNKAIGGETFCPKLGRLPDDFVPDYITVAYGTNDWCGKSREVFMEDCRTFFLAVSENYPATKIFAITPIWRKDMTEEKAFGSFEEVDGCIREAVRGIKNICVISGFDFIPQDELYFADLRLHPNDEGFAIYAEKLYQNIKGNL